MTEPTTDDPGGLLDSLTYTDEPAQDLPPTADDVEQGMVITSLKWTPEMRRRVREVSAEHGITPSMLIRQYIEMGLVAENPEQMIPLSDAIRALSSLRRSA